MDNIGTVEMICEELCFGDDKLGSGKAVLYHFLDYSRV